MTQIIEVNDPGTFALRRWKLGHQAFNFILEGMVDSIERSRKFLLSSDHPALSHELTELAFLYRAATSAFNYAAAFDPELYTAAVRPSMMPPFLPEGFSGTLNCKHKEMKHVLQLLQKELSVALAPQWPEELKQAWEAVLHAKSENLKNHGLVCSRFVPGGQSLLREHYANKRKETITDDPSL